MCSAIDSATDRSVTAAKKRDVRADGEDENKAPSQSPLVLRQNAAAGGLVQEGESRGCVVSMQRG